MIDPVQRSKFAESYMREKEQAQQQTKASGDKPNWHLRDARTLPEKVRDFAKKRPLAFVALLIVLVIVIYEVWNSSPWTLDPHAAEYRLLTAEQAHLGMPGSWSVQDGRTDDRGTFPIGHAPSIQIKYVLGGGMCADAQSFYTTAAQKAGWTVVRAAPTPTDTSTVLSDPNMDPSTAIYRKAVQTHAFKLTVTCQPATDDLFVRFDG